MVRSNRVGLPWRLLAACQLLVGTAGLAPPALGTKPFAAEGAALSAKLAQHVRHRQRRLNASQRRSGDIESTRRSHGRGAVPSRLQAVVRSQRALDSTYPKQEYQCGSEYPDPKYGCRDCNMTRTCACDGIVRFGYGKRWTEFFETSGEIDCSAATFGEDPASGYGKVCMCRPRIFMCASEWSEPWGDCPECTSSRTCNCIGQVRFGYGDAWTEWQSVNGSIQCERAEFGDPFGGHGKLCQCQPFDLYTEPLFGHHEGGSLGTVLRSILTITVTYFLIFTLLAVNRTCNRFKFDQIGPSPIERVLELATSQCVYFAPMLCVVFFAVSKRAYTLTGGAPLEYNLPAPWLQGAIGCCTAAFCVQTASFVLGEWFLMQGTGAAASSGRWPHFAVREQAQDFRMARCWRTLCNVATALMYLALAVTLAGVLLMEEPTGVRASVGRTPVRSSTVCTLIFAVVYFTVYLVLHMFRNQESAQAARGASVKTSYAFEVMKLAATAMNFAPMLCILFMGTQIAADWAGIDLPGHTATWMYVCLVSVLLQVFLVVMAPFLASAEMQVIGPRGEVDFVTESQHFFVVISIIRWFAMTALYVGVAAVSSTLWRTQAVPALTHQLYRFAWLYFAAYLALWTAITARQLAAGGWTWAIRVLSVVKDVVVLCPMMSALFLASFMRAHTITNVYGNPGEPQNYVQDFMVVSVCAIGTQAFVVVLAGFCSPRSGVEHPIFLWCFNVAMMILFVSLFVIVFGLFAISASNADRRGAWFA